MHKRPSVVTPVKVKTKGTFSLRLIGGEKDIVVCADNLIVDAGMEIIARWGIPGVTDDERPGYIALGTGGHAAGDSSVPLPPTPSDSSLETEVARRTIDTYDTASGALVMVCTFDNDVAVGDLTEAGLFTADGRMLSRVTFAGVAKTSSLYAMVTWSYAFTNDSVEEGS